MCARLISQGQGEPEIRPIHVVWALAGEPGSLATEILRKAGLEAPAPVTAVSAGPANDEILSLPLTNELKSVIQRSVAMASRFRHKYVGTEHLLLSLLEKGDKEVGETLAQQHIDHVLLIKHLGMVMKSTSRFPDLTLALSQGGAEFEDEEGEAPRGQKKSKTPALDFFGRELTSSQVQARIDPVIGRAREINRIIQILSRKNKNNPILLGDPGVGKTAIVEGLAKRIIQGEVPDILLRKRVYSLDLALMVSGTMYRGEFETRIKQVLDEVKADPDLILFIDELHTIIGAGSASGSLDAANILKPALARGEIRCIGATTNEEYKRHIETDPALERRFQAIQVGEPSIAETIDILKGIARSYEQHHHVRVSDEALTAAAQLSAHYLPEKRLPDKAIDLIDEASAMKRIAQGGAPFVREHRELETKLGAVIQKKEDAVRAEDFPRALSLKEEERTLRTAMAAVETRASQQETSGDAPSATVTKGDIVRVLSDMTGIPLGTIQEEERAHLARLEEHLRARIVGQDDVLKEIAGYIRRARAGLSGAARPIGSFIFLGPSGVGKTETAKALAEIVFRDPHALIRLDMAEYGESFNITKLIGAPAGYVGYREGGKLTDMVRRKPYAVILLDEIEKAHPDVFNLFLSILDEGRVTDATGRTVDFRNTIIIMTSNIGLPAFNQHAALGFSAHPGETAAVRAYTHLEDTALRDLREHFRPEFLNRVDHVFVFHPLDPHALTAIIELHLQTLRTSLAAQSLTLAWDAHAVSRLTELSLSPGEGARKVARVVRAHVEDAIAEKILHHNDTSPRMLTLSAKGETITLHVHPASRAAKIRKPRRAPAASNPER
jgi:ATP-dependent Clp protease ATP-binding subunit ClpC